MNEFIPATWSAQLASVIGSDDFKRLRAFVAQERADHPGRIFPPAPEVFAALELTPFDTVRAVILGMDPYHRTGQTSRAQCRLLVLRDIMRPPGQLQPQLR